MRDGRSFCDGLARRDLLRVGVAGFFGAGLSLERLLAAESQPSTRDTGASVILVFLKGGLSTIDTFDLKPQARRAPAR